MKILHTLYMVVTVYDKSSKLTQKGRRNILSAEEIVLADKSLLQQKRYFSTRSSSAFLYHTRQYVRGLNVIVEGGTGESQREA